MSIVRAIDVGHKNVKWVLDPGGEISCRVFPARALLAKHRDLSDTLGRKRQTVLVEVKGLAYEVGPDTALAPTSAHNMDDDYCLSDEYLALVRGALAYMKVPLVDFLVVGLPMTTFETRRTELAKRLMGEHPITDGRDVVVREVKVLAQPHGALLDFAVADVRAQALRSQRNLIIDCGARTFDWLVTQGLKVIEQRSHASHRGMYDVLQVLAEEIGRRFNEQFHDYERLDGALRTGARPQVFGRQYDLAPHLPIARKIARDAVTEMRRYVQDTSDIDNIVVAGGAAFFFIDAIRSAFPHHDILEGRDGLYANVRGFIRYGLTRCADGKRATEPGTASTPSSGA